MINKIAIASDHAGFELKQLLIESLPSDLEIEDLGTRGIVQWADPSVGGEP